MADEVRKRIWMRPCGTAPVSSPRRRGIITIECSSLTTPAFSSAMSMRRRLPRTERQSERRNDQSSNVSSESDVDRMFAAVLCRIRRVLTRSSTTPASPATGGVEDIEPAEWRRCIDIDLTGQFLCTRRAVPMLKSAGGGSIINMSSAAGRHGYAYRTPYSSAKFGIIGLTQSLAKELGPANIRVNAILPGIIEGPRMERVIPRPAAQLNVGYDTKWKKHTSSVSRFCDDQPRCRRHDSVSYLGRRGQHFRPVDWRRRQRQEHFEAESMTRVARSAAGLSGELGHFFLRPCGTRCRALGPRPGRPAPSD